MNHEQQNSQRLGIMGGGQLGLYLCQAARSLGITTTVLEPNAQGSAFHTADSGIVAGLDDLAAVDALVEASDVITFELEAIPDPSLARLLEAEQRGDIQVRPSVDTLMLFKDKGVQKEWLSEESLPTLPYLTVEQGQLPDAFSGPGWKLPVVQKAHRGGYDGKGVQLLRTEADLGGIWNVPSYLEPALSPCREIGVVVARGLDGELAAFPPVSMEFDDRYNSVFSVTSPGVMSETLAQEATALALRAIGALNAPGVFAVELFVDSDEGLTINEISPRVHNSGHLTMEGFLASQFEQHVRAVMGLPLAAVTPAREAAVMLNLLYEDAFEAACPGKPESWLHEDGVPVTVHWYGKSTGQAGRKMGHLTAIAADPDAAMEAARRVLKQLKSDPKAFYDEARLLPLQ